MNGKKPETTKKIQKAINDLWVNNKETGVTLTRFLESIGCDNKTLRIRPDLLRQFHEFQQAHPTPAQRRFKERVDQCVAELERLAESRLAFSIEDVMRKFEFRYNYYQKNDQIFAAFTKARIAMSGEMRRLSGGGPSKADVLLKAAAHMRLKGAMQVDSICFSVGVNRTDYNKAIVSDWLENDSRFQATRHRDPSTGRVYKILFCLANSEQRAA